MGNNQLLWSCAANGRCLCRSSWALAAARRVHAVQNVPWQRGERNIDLLTREKAFCMGSSPDTTHGGSAAPHGRSGAWCNSSPGCTTGGATPQDPDRWDHNGPAPLVRSVWRPLVTVTKLGLRPKNNLWCGPHHEKTLISNTSSKQPCIRSTVV